jgi:hypothetical protein
MIMKTSFKTLVNLRGLAFTAALAASGSLSHAAPLPPPPSPAGTGSFTWDCITTGGGQQGITFLTFSNDFTFTGYVLVAGVPPPPSSSTSTSGSRNTSTSGRGGSGSSGTTSGTNVINTVFGFTQISGPWGFDNSRRIIGFFIEPVNVTAVATNYSPTNVLEFIDAGNGDTTNVLVNFTSAATASTNITWTAPVAFSHTYIFENPNSTVVPTASQITNTISFTGTVVPGRQLALVASTAFGNVTYIGVPFKTNLTDLTGNWYGTKLADGRSYIEFFNLTSTVGSPEGFPNIYFMDGQGPGYTYTNGFCVVSAQNKIGFALLEQAGSGTLRASFGPFLKPGGVPMGQTKGVIESTGSSISFNANKALY